MPELTKFYSKHICQVKVVKQQCKIELSCQQEQNTSNDQRVPMMGYWFPEI